MRWSFSAAALAIGIAFGLAGCGGGVSGVLGGGTQSAAPVGQQTGPGSTLRNLFLYGGPTVPVSQAPGFNQKQDEFGCPELNILDGAAGYRGGTAAQQASGVAFQASIANVARECNVQGREIRVRVGVEGRVLLGQNGRPGNFSVPVRVVVKRRNDIVTQRFTRLNVTVPSTDSQADFAYIEENLVLPITENDPGDEYDVYVGLDPTGQQASRQTRQTRRR